MSDEKRPVKRSNTMTPEQKAAIDARAEELAQTGGVAVSGPGWSAFVDGGPSAFHPYECRAGCVHCSGARTEHHDPDDCAICEACDEFEESD